MTRPRRRLATLRACLFAVTVPERRRITSGTRDYSEFVMDHIHLPRAIHRQWAIDTEHLLTVAHIYWTRQAESFTPVTTRPRRVSRKRFVTNAQVTRRNVVKMDDNYIHKLTNLI